MPQVKWEWGFDPLNDEQLGLVKDFWEIELPDDYLLCAKLHHGARPEPNTLNMPRKKGAVLDHLLRLVDVDDPDEDRSAFGVYRAIKKNLPAESYPIAADPFGNYFCLRYEQGKFCDIIYWDHETDECLKVASTFTEMLAMLRA